MKLKRFKERDNKRIGIIVFTISCILLVSGVILYRTFAIFEVRTNQNVINGTVQDPGDIYFAFYQKNEETGEYEIKKEMPQKKSGYVLDDINSYCGVNGEKNPNIKVSVNEDWKIIVSGVTTSRTKCNLYFTKGIFIMGHGVPVVTNGDGLYKVEHGDEVTDTTNDIGFKQTEYRYAGKNPNNYIDFNNEKWRIIGLVNVMTSEDDVEQRVKIIRDDEHNTPFGNFAWDSSNVNDWTKSSLMKYLNGDYYETLNTVNQSMIDEDIIWNINAISSNKQNFLVDLWYNNERGMEKQSYFWKKENTAEDTTFHSIGLIYPSDYWYATSGGELGRERCLEYSLYAPGWNKDNNGKNFCKINNWIRPNASKLYWSITSYLGNQVVYPIDNGHIGSNLAYTLYAIIPTLYLKPILKISDGIGSLEDSFVIEDYYL